MNLTLFPSPSAIEQFLQQTSLSCEQQYLWYMQQKTPDWACNVTMGMHIRGALNVLVLQQTLNKIVRRHEILRATFPTQEGQPCLIVIPELDVSLDIISRNETVVVEREAAIKYWFMTEAQHKFNLSQGPLLKACLLTFSEGDHVLFITTHALVADYWSMATLLHELAALYRGLIADESLEPPLPTQYSDYVTQQHHGWHGQAVPGGWQYGQDLWTGSPPTLELSGKRLPTPDHSLEASHPFVVPRTLFETLKNFQHPDIEITLPVILLTALNVLLVRYAKRSSMALGVITNNRMHFGQADSIGQFANKLILQTEIAYPLTFQEALEQLQRSMRDASADGSFPIIRLLETQQLQQEKEFRAFPPLTFTWQGDLPLPLEFAGLTLRPLGITDRSLRSDLSLIMRTQDGELRGEWRYNPALFDETTIKQLGEHYFSLLQNAVRLPQIPVAYLPFLSGTEEKQLLYDWNHTDTPFSQYRCIHELFEEKVEETPEAVALIFEDEAVTYEALNQQANRLAHYLRGLGVQADALVGLCLERSIEMIVALLGILKAGGAYVPLDPNYPQERLAFIREDAQVQVLLTQQRLAKQLGWDETQCIYLDTDQNQTFIAQQPSHNLAGTAIADNLAYAIYTSGSTGVPKGALLTHRGLCNLADAQIRIFELTNDLRILQFSSLNFDASIFEIVMALRVGATLCLGTQASLRPGPDLLAFLRNQAVTNVTLPPSVLTLLPTETLPALKTVIVAGEACPPDLVARWSEGRHFFNAYGPTETTVWATVAQCDHGAQKPPIGRPIPNTQIYLLDEHLQLVPIGMNGEVYIGGIGLARGYLRRPALTAERFIPHPFSHEPGARLYKTGDLARYLPDGNIEFVGRIDHQVKLRGFRIELGEVETALSRHPAVRETVVVIREDIPGNQQLVAYLVADPQPGNDELRRYLQTKLPEYMVPTTFVALAALPLNANGKVDRQALPLPNPARAASSVPFIPPRNSTEEGLAQIWSELLGIEPISMEDNFFEIGGHSLLATQLASRIHDTFQVTLPLDVIFKAPTLAGLADHVAQSDIHPPTFIHDLPPVHQAPRDEPLPLSFSQERIWFLNQLDPDSIAYNTQLTIDFQGRLNVRALEEALTEIVRRHEVFRTTFPAIHGRPVQVIHPPFIVKLPIKDLTGIVPELQEAEIAKHFFAETRQPFDTAQLPLIRWALLKLHPERHVLIQVEHHFVHDGWSLAVLLRETKILYEAFEAGRPSPLPELPLQFADLAVWQRQWLQGPVLEELTAYWTEQLEGMPAFLQLPTDRPRPKVQSYQGAVEQLEIPADLYDALRDLSQREGFTLFMIMLTAFAILLHRYTQQDDLVVGSGVANRRLRESESLIGMLINTLVLRLNMAENPSVYELLRRIRHRCLGAYTHQDMPFGKLVDILQPERNVSYSPLFQVSFSFHDSPVPDLIFPDLVGSIRYGNNQSAKFDLNVIAIPRVEQLFSTRHENDSDKLVMVWEYNTDLFAAATIKRMLGHYQTILLGMIRDLSQHVSDLPLLTEAEKQQLLYAWNHTQATVVPDICIHQLFEQQVTQTPEATAVLAGAQCLSYFELNQRANQLAHYLRDLGVTAETLVGLCVERSPEMIIGLLGILKAGGAYVPLDPSYPSTRLQFMLEDTQIDVLLTQQHLTEQVSSHQAQLIYLDTTQSLIDQQPTGNLPNLTSPANLAYVIYTSGSTGKPKGVLITHQGVNNLIQAAIHDLNILPQSRILQLASLSFDASVLEIFAALSTGSQLYLLEREKAMSASELARCLDEWRIHFLAIPPSFLDVIPEAHLPALRTIVVGGEACPANTVTKWASGRRFFNAYAPTEATIYSTLMACTEARPQGPPLGRPIKNMEVYVLDPSLQPVPVGIPGEIYLGGIGLARGYWRRASLTAERFVPHPFSHEPGQRLYKTGDLARYLPDGNLEFMGRVDYQVKLRGFRIELGEVETVLNQHPDVRENVVVLREDTSGNKRLVAYLVAQNRHEPTADELRSYLQTRLPTYMLPATFVKLAALPLTLHGKVDRDNLPRPDTLRPELTSDFMPPTSPVEKALTQIWEDVLGLQKVGIHDNFFSLGGDSILSIQIIARANSAGVPITTRQLFEHQTVAGLATVVGQEAPALSEQGIITGFVPLTPIQHWFFERELDQPHHWNQAMLFEARQFLSPKYLEQAVKYLLSHHDALRLRFTESSGRWQQHIAAPGETIPFTKIDLSILSEAEQLPALKSAAAELQTSLDLENGPLFRVVLLEREPVKPNLLLLIAHHLVIDAVSWQILLEDLQTTYQQASQGETLRLPLKTTSFKQWAEHLMEYAQSPSLKKELPYWLSLSGEKEAELPVDFDHGDNTEMSTDLISVSLTSEETQVLLYEVPTAYNTQINDALLTALAKTLVEWLGTSCVQIDLEGHGREDMFDYMDISRTVGWFTTIYPVRLEPGHMDDIGNVLKTIKEQLRRIPNRGFGYGSLRYLDAGNHRPGTWPQAEVSFNYIGQLDRRIPESSLLRWVDDLSSLTHDPLGKRCHLIDIKGQVVHGQLHIYWKYSQHFHRRDTITRLAQRFMECLRSIIAHCQLPDTGGYTPSDFPDAGLNQEELDRLANFWDVYNPSQ